LESEKHKTTFSQKILLLAVCISILALIEIGLRIFNFPDRSSSPDPFIGFEKVYPLFNERKSSDGKTVCFTNSNKLSFFNFQEFEKKKSLNTYRIFCFGGSTTFGRPYSGETAFPRWLDVYLNLMDPDRKYEVINTGGISYASYRIVHLVEEVIKYQPDLFVLYTGHNEFLEARTYENILKANPILRKIRVFLNKFNFYVLYRNIILGIKNTFSKSENELDDEVTTILDASAGLERYSREKLQKKITFDHYRYNLNTIIRLAEKNNIKIILATLTSNLKDFSPFKSQHKDDITEDELVKWNEHYQNGYILQNQNQYQQALVVYEQCMQIDDQYAGLIYNIGQCMSQLKKYDLAREYFQRAKELDIAPLRAPKEINSVIQKLGSEFDIPVVDISAKFKKLSPHQIPDNTLIIDHVHPSIRGNQIIAEELAKVLQSKVFLKPEEFYEQELLSVVYGKILDSLPDDYYTKGILNLAKVLGWAGKEEEKKLILTRNIGKFKDNPEYHYMMGNTFVREGRLDEAIYEFRKSIEINPDFGEAYTNLGFALEQNGLADDALQNYRTALSLNPDDYVAQTNIGRIFFIREDYENAIIEYEKAVRMNLDYPDARLGLGVVYYRQYHIDEALKELNVAIELNPNYGEAYYNVGLIHLGEKKTGEAIANFKKAIDIDPMYDDAHVSLGVCYYQQKRISEAIEQLNKALKINPRSGKAHNNLAVVYYSSENYDLSLKHIESAQRMKYTVNPDLIKAIQEAKEQNK